MTLNRMNMALYNLLKRIPGTTEDEAIEGASMDGIGTVESELVGVKSRLDKIETKLEYHDNYFKIMLGFLIAIILLLLNLSFRI